MTGVNRNMNEVQLSSLFVMCGEKPFAEVGFEYGLDKKYKSVASMKTAVSKLYTKVKNNPEKYGISYEKANEIVSKIDARQVEGLQGMTPEKLTLREQTEILNPKDLKGMLIGARNKNIKLIFDKLNQISGSKRLLEETPLTQLATTFGIIFDKSQIILGQSTENIAVLSKIDKDLKPEDALGMVLRMREQTIVEKAA